MKSLPISSHEKLKHNLLRSAPGLLLQPSWLLLWTLLCPDRLPSLCRPLSSCIPRGFPLLACAANAGGVRIARFRARVSRPREDPYRCVSAQAAAGAWKPFSLHSRLSSLYSFHNPVFPPQSSFPGSALWCSRFSSKGRGPPTHTRISEPYFINFPCVLLWLARLSEPQLVVTSAPIQESS